MVMNRHLLMEDRLAY